MSAVSSNETREASPPRSSLRQNLVAMYALQAANYIIPLVTLPYLVRTLGTEHYGILAGAYATVFFMTLFLDAGTNTVAVRELAQSGNDRRRVARIYCVNTLLKLWLATAMGIVLALLIAAVPTGGHGGNEQREHNAHRRGQPELQQRVHAVDARNAAPIVAALGQFAHGHGVGPGVQEQRHEEDRGVGPGQDAVVLGPQCAHQVGQRHQRNDVVGGLQRVHRHQVLAQR
ncbi:MAG: oligosaccharide flippase family protein [Pseudomonadota bacterium]